MNLLYVPLILMVAAGAATAPPPLVETDFGSATIKAVTRGGRDNPNIRGVLPEGWFDDSGWAPTQIAYERLEEEGRPFLRARVLKADEGRCQLTFPLPKIEGETFYRLNLTARSLTRIPLQVGFRDSGTPYRFAWETKPKLSASWQEFSYDFRLDKYEPEIGLWLVLDGVGELDLARVRLVRLTRADYIAELKARYPGGGPKNLLRVSRFPLGLQSGWALSRDNSDGDDVVVAPDPAVVGLSGAPALKVQTAEPTVLYGAPFAVPLAFETHTASLYAKGSGTLRLSVLGDGRQLAQKSFDLTNDWQRLQVAFEPALMGKAYGLRLDAGATFWIDALQVAPGKDAGAYVSQLPCEVSLAIPRSDASPALVQFADEPAVVRYAVTGEAAGASLKAKVVNAYGEEAALPPVRLRAGIPTQGELRCDRFPNRPFGPFRVEAWVEDAQGRPLSAPNELVLYRLPRPRYWGKDAPSSPFGVHTQSTTRHNLMTKAVGANWTRLHDAGLQYLGWYHLERKQGEWTFYDKEIHRYRRDHVKILGELGTAPEWASYFPKPHNGYFDRFYQPKRLENYANYVRVVTQRYRGVIDAYDVWNEPWIWAWWGVGYDETQPDRAGYLTSKEPQADFARLMRTAYENAKATDPKITILGINSTTGGGSARSFGGEEWTRGVVAAGGMDHCDAVCYHNYISGKPGYPGDVCEKGFQAATGPIQERFGKQPKPVWMTEGSAGRDTIGPGFYHHTLPYPNPEHPMDTGDRLCRYVVSLLAQGVQKVFLYSMHSHSSLLASSEWRVLVTPEGMLHPSGAAHAAMAWQLEDTRFVKQFQVAEGVTAYLFEGAGRAVAALSALPDAKPYTPPARPGLSVVDLFGNPVPAGQPGGETLAYVTAKGSAGELEKMLGK